jgi:flagellar hook-basal body complex protein FliE
MKEITFEKNLESLLGPPIKSRQAPGEHRESFSDMLSNSIGEVNRLKLEADQAIQDMVAGKGKGIHETMIAVQKAEISFHLMMEVRNKIVAAYDQVMRMGG